MSAQVWADLLAEIETEKSEAQDLLRRCLNCWSRAAGTLHALKPWYPGGPWPKLRGELQRMAEPKLLLHLGGTMEFHHGGPVLMPAPGDVVVVPGHATTSERSDGGYANMLICPRAGGCYVQFAMVPGTASKAGRRPVVHAWSDPRGGMQLTAVLQLLGGGGIPDAVALRTAEAWLMGLRHMLAGLLDSPADSQVALGPPVLRVALDLIARNHADPKFTIAKLAAAAGAHPVVLARLLRRYTGRSTRSHLEEARLAHAERLLTDPACTIAGAARSAGFANARHLRRAFVRNHGGPPNRRRREAHRA